MNVKLKKLLVLVVAVFLAVVIFYPNTLNRFVKRKLRVYSTAPSGTLKEVMFQKIVLNDKVKGQYTSLVIGPDHKLYAGAIDGKVKRFIIQASGDLILEHIFEPYGKESKFSIGFAFDPKSKPDSLIVWTTCSESTSDWVEFANTQNTFNTSNWAGSMRRMHLSSTSDQVLKNEWVLKELPRFGPNHENFANSIVFGPDGKLYFGQGANTGMGLCDCKENKEPSREALLSGTILCLDLSKLSQNLPIVVKTADGGGSYDPYDSLAPLKIFATGLRNAYDLVWHSNGQLYATINGSGGNENTPTSDPESSYYIPPFKQMKYTGPKDIPAVIGAHPDQNDFMARVEQGGYYGHPNPLRAEYVLNHGDTDLDNFEYNGIEPDSNFKGFTYDFGPHVSPTGIIEYTSDTFEGNLKGCLIAVRMVHNDLVVIRPGGEKNDIIEDYDGSAMGLVLEGGPLDIVEDTRTGNIYVSEFGNKTITLFRPNENKTVRKVHQRVTKIKEPFDSLENGKAIYEQNCQICHGVKGRGGTGPSLIDNEWINVKGNMLVTIANGSSNGAMPAWKDKLSTKEITRVESYLLSLNKIETD